MIHSRSTVQRTVFPNQPLLLLLTGCWKEKFNYTEFRYDEPIDTANRPKTPLAPSIESPLYVDESTSERRVCVSVCKCAPLVSKRPYVLTFGCGFGAVMTTVKLRSLWKLATYVRLFLTSQKLCMRTPTTLSSSPCR